ncbi:MAG TPA: T9SS type A sorting domain-containing protein [Bacteroidia bacterium]|nr:T9SS type A sorting domain-containing protein [Bacteroidia bacterium]
MISFRPSLLFIFLFTVIINSNAQIPGLAYQKNFGGSSDEFATEVHQTADGGFIVIGYSDSPDGDVTGNYGWKDVWVIKLDSALDMQWQKNYGGSAFDQGMEIIQRADGGYTFMALSQSDDHDVTGNHGQSDIWIVKLDNAGNIQSERSYGGSFHESDSFVFPEMKFTDDGGLLVVTSSNSNDGDVSGNHGGPDVWVFKTDSTGNIQWQKCLGGSNADNGYSIDATYDGGYIVAGDTKSIDGDVTGLHDPGGFTVDYWIVKLDSSGTIQWQKCLGGTESEVPDKIIQLSDSNYVVTGYTFSDDGDVTSIHGSSDGWIVKLDTAGNIIWQRCLGGSGSDRISSLQQLNDGGFIGSGYTISTDGMVSGLRGGYDTWVVKVDSACSLQWQKCLGGSDFDGGYSIDLTTNGYVVGGYGHSNDIDVTNNKGGYDSWVLSLASHYNSITGQVYYDTITNGQLDAGEPVIYNKIISEPGTGRIALTGPDGKYNLTLLTPGSFSVQAPGVSNYTISPPFHTAAFAALDEMDSLNDFPAAPIPGIHDLQIDLVPYGDYSPGFTGGYGLVCKNAGTTFQSATVKLFPGDYLTYQSSSVPPAIVTADSIVWNAVNLVPLQETIIGVIFSVSITAPVGSPIETSSQIEPITTDVSPADNSAGWRNYVTSSADPNDKIVSDSILTTTQVASQTYLDYIIRFQNTGTDTAVNVMITDNISRHLDMTTFEYRNASHPVQADYQQASRLIIFHFDNIQLADSNVNEPLSHGFVHYRIKPYDTLTAGHNIVNKAAIFFDFNLPVITNTVKTRIVLPVSVEENQSAFLSFRVYPNPAGNQLIVTDYLLTGEEGEVIVYDLFGREVYQSKVSATEHKIKIDVSRFNSGIYFLRMSSGSVQVSKKFAVQH